MKIVAQGIFLAAALGLAWGAFAQGQGNNPQPTQVRNPRSTLYCERSSEFPQIVCCVNTGTRPQFAGGVSCVVSPQ